MSLPVLPTLLTAGNLVCGLTAIFCGVSDHNLLFEGAVLVFAAMACDMLDGKVARLTGSAGEFGAELDSLADMVSFGVAPAMLVHRLVLGDNPTRVWGDGEQLIWLIAVFYAVMTALRLARYNVEHSNEQATSAFRGLPSPGAAAFLCSWVLFYAWLQRRMLDEGSSALTLSLEWAVWDHLLRLLLSGSMPLMALLMVSSIPFPHVGNTILREQIRLRHLILLLLAIGALVMFPVYGLVLGTSLYVILALARGLPAVARRWGHGRDLLDEDEDDAEGAAETGTPDTDPPARRRSTGRGRSGGAQR